MPKGNESAAQLQAINRFLFDELGFCGDDRDYYVPRNSYLNDVLDRRMGNPISLAVVQIELARRLGVPLEGISFPGHFLVRPAAGGRHGRARSLPERPLARCRRTAPSRAGAHRLARTSTTTRLARMLEPASHRAILTRMLRNLKGVYAEREQWDKAAALLRPPAHRSTAPVGIRIPRSRRVLPASRSRARRTRGLGSRYLALMPHADDAEEIALKLAELGSATPRLN